MGVDSKYVEVVAKRSGSVIVDYDIISDKNNLLSLDDMKKKNDQVLKDGNLDLGGTILSYKSGTDPEVTTYVEPVKEEKEKSNTVIIIGIIFGVAFVLLLSGIFYAKKLQTGNLDIHPEDKFEEDEKLPMPKQKVDLKDIESNDSVNVLKQQEPIKISKDDVVVDVDNSQDALMKKDESKELKPSIETEEFAKVESPPKEAVNIAKIVPDKS
jgi:hypothetical protein